MLTSSIGMHKEEEFDLEETIRLIQITYQFCPEDTQELLEFREMVRKIIQTYHNVKIQKSNTYMEQ